jgi:hypothetical protein
MTDYTVWTSDKAPEGVSIPHGVTVRWVYDECYQSEGSYSYDTDEETAEAVAYELERLADGRWVALGCIVEDEQGEHLDSLWGIVIGQDEAELAEFFNHSIEVPTELQVAEDRFERAEQAVEVARKLLVDAKIREAGADPAAIEDFTLWGFLRALWKDARGR